MQIKEQQSFSRILGNLPNKVCFILKTGTADFVFRFEENVLCTYLLEDTKKSVSDFTNDIKTKITVFNWILAESL